MKQDIQVSNWILYSHIYVVFQIYLWFKTFQTSWIFSFSLSHRLLSSGMERKIKVKLVAKNFKASVNLNRDVYISYELKTARIWM